MLDYYVEITHHMEWGNIMNLSSIGSGYRRVVFIGFLFVMATLLVVIGVVVTNNSKKEYKEAQATITEIVVDQIGEDTTCQEPMIEITGLKKASESISH